MAAGALRRQTILKNAGERMTLRKSIIVSDTSQSFMEASDDEIERSKRRSNVDIQRRLSNISMQDRSTNSVAYNESYINEQFVLCTHLFTENKITSKNVWKVQIINMLKPLCQQPGKDNLQVAGTSIDISAKVYSIRVDDVYSEGLRLASTLARTAQIERENEEGDGNDETAQGCHGGKKRKRRKVNVDGDKNTIAKSIKSLIGSVGKLEPVDFLSRVKAETGTIDNLFTNTLKEDNLSSTFILDDDSKRIYINSDTTVKNVTKNLPVNLKHLPQLTQTSLKLCIPFTHFQIDDWSPENEEKFTTDKSDTLDQVVLDKDGFPIPELDGSIHDIFENNDNVMDDSNDNYIQSMHEEIAPQLRGEVAKIVDFIPNNDITQVSEYSYNVLTSTRSGKFIDQIWAGPSHWKLKFLKKSGMRFSGQNVLAKECNKRKKAAPEMIDFTKDVDIDLSQLLVVKRKRPIVDENKITLPVQDLSSSKFLRNYNELMLKPGVCPIEKKHQNKCFNHNVSTYKYENPNDSLYCPEVNGDDGDDLFPDNMDNECSPTDGQEYLEENLVDAPQMVTNAYVPYALKAKQMDMKRLKAAVWLILTGQKAVPDKNVKEKIEKMSFSEMYKLLPGLLNNKEKDELTCPLAFVALLHLCNEQNLHLSQHSAYKDFDIQSAK